MFSSQISMKSLAVVCRSLSTMLRSGVSIQKAFGLAHGKAGEFRCRRALDGVRDRVSRGDQVAEAMRDQEGAFPELMIDMVEVAEKTGALPEVLLSLSGHYENNLRLKREFYGTIAWPVFQLIVAILIVAFLIFILGIIQNPGMPNVDVLGLGLTGARGAMIWLACTFGTLAAIVIGYQLIKTSLFGAKFLDPLLLWIPVVGNCLRSFAIARFSWAFALTQQAGMPIEESIKSSLRATSNGAFVAAAEPIWRTVKEGGELTEALDASGLFPSDYLHMVEVAERSGTVPEMLDHLSPQFEDQARRSLRTLAAVCGWGIWLLVAGFIIVLIFSIVLRMYINPLSEAVREVQGI